MIEHGKPQTVSNASLLWTAMAVLRDGGRPMEGRDVLAHMSEQLDLTPYWLERYSSGQVRWMVAVQFFTGDAATIGWMTKRGGWAITEAGLAAMETLATQEALFADCRRRYALIHQRRIRAQENLGEVQQFIARTLGLVEAGSWTAFDDIATLASTSGTEVADFLASGKVRLPNAYRVLNADGSVPAEGMLNAAYRGSDLLALLASEGVEVGADGKAAQEQRLTADALMDLLATEADEDLLPLTPARRAWMVRGSNVDGYNLVPDWLRDGYVSLSASQLGPVDPDASLDQLRQQVEAGYEHKSYAYRAQRFEEFDRFLRRIQIGNLVLTTMRGEVYLGMVISTSYFTDTEDGHSNLRRDVTWYAPQRHIEGAQLEAPVPALLQSQAYVVDLTEAYPQLAALVPDEEKTAERSAPTSVAPPRQLAFHAVTTEFAKELLLDQADLETITDLLWERRQIVLYGPPGTGKTWLARKLAAHLTDDGAVKLVQFHPSYTYEDFFEGFRPEPGGDGTLTFSLRAGPFRDFAEIAVDNPATPYILIIDEINRANLAKVFGELYFLLEYRDQPVTLQYSPDREFTLPRNLFIIGTMNTADRSIARIDAAMRRRFAFVELDPRVPPVKGLLGRWLAKLGLPLDAAFLLDELNLRIEDADAAIGPSYLMDERIYKRADGLDRVWKYSIMPLLDDLFYGQSDLGERYGLASLRAGIAHHPDVAEPSDEP
jgi:5-methylcytosine-specific restriction protein B